MSITEMFKLALGCALKGVARTSLVAGYLFLLYCIMFFITWGFPEGGVVNWWGLGGRFALVVWIIITASLCYNRKKT